MKKIAYLGWLGAGNLGDEGCYELFRRGIRASSADIACIPITIRESKGALLAQRAGAAPRPIEPWRPEEYDWVVLGGGSLLNAGRYIEALALAQAAGVPTAVWGAGFDGLPHDLVRSLLSGKKPSGDAISRAPQPHPRAPEVLRSCRVAGVRGPVSAVWLQANGCGPVSVTGDPGLLLEPLPGETGEPREPCLASSGAARSGNGESAPTPGRIAVIWGASHRATHPGASHQALTRATARWLTKLARHRPVVVGAMWSHDLPAAAELAALLGERAQFLDTPLTLSSFRALMHESAATLSYRLHGCIFSAACGTPFCSVAYRSKCYDFAHSIGAGAWVVEPGDPDFEERLDRWLAEACAPSRKAMPDPLARKILQHRESLTRILQQITHELGEGG